MVEDRQIYQMNHPGVQSNSIERRVRDLQSHIRDVGDEVDAYKAGTAAAIGGAVFCLLLSLGGLYDIATGKAGLWSEIGLSRQTFHWLVAALGALSIVLFILARIRERRRDLQQESRLAEIEQELCELQGQTGQPEERP